MDNIYNLLNDLKSSLDNDKNIKALKKSYTIIKSDKDLYNKIKEYNNTHDEALRLELINNPKIKNTKHLEAIINYMILEINNSLKSISKKDGCQ